jgi:hypothetical protein
MFILALFSEHFRAYEIKKFEEKGRYMKNKN